MVAISAWVALLTSRGSGLIGVHACSAELALYSACVRVERPWRTVGAHGHASLGSETARFTRIALRGTRFGRE